MKKAIVLIVLPFIICAGVYVFAQEEKVVPKKIKADTNYDGKVDRVEYYTPEGEPERMEADRDFDGKYDEWIYYKDGKVSRVEKDTNADGKPDTWIDY